MVFFVCLVSWLYGILLFIIVLLVVFGCGSWEDFDDGILGGFDFLSGDGLY